MQKLCFALGANMQETAAKQRSPLYKQKALKGAFVKNELFIWTNIDNRML